MDHAAAAYLMLREATEDSVLNLPKPVGEQGNTQLAVQKGTTVRPLFDHGSQFQVPFSVFSRLY